MAKVKNLDGGVAFLECLPNTSWLVFPIKASVK